MKERIFTGLVIAAFSGCLHGQMGIYLTDKIARVWEVKGLEIPESVLPVLEERIMYVSNIGKITTNADKDKNGFISVITFDGEIRNLRWATGLNAPKGMAIIGDKLFVTDIDRIVEIELNSGNISNEYPVDSSVFLNDIVASGEGVLYFTDSQTGSVHKLDSGVVSTVAKSKTYRFPNGIAIVNDTVLFGTGDRVVMIDPATGSTEDFLLNTGGVDGLAEIAPGEFLFSDWGGQIHRMKKGEDKELLLDTSITGNAKTADFGYDPGTRRIFIPTFFGNSVVCYMLNPN